MWRFILTSFAVLGWAFYALSGGSDYRPASRVATSPINMTALDQAAALPNAPVPTGGEPTPNDHQALANLPHIVSRLENSPTPREDFDKNVGSITLASATSETTLLSPENTEQLVLDVDKAKDVLRPTTHARTARDIRKVTGNRVNMRGGPGKRYGVISKLDKDTEIQFLSNAHPGWVKLRVLETGRVGYMADWLITAAAP